LNQPPTTEPAPQLAPEAGWYQDPHGPGLRWWDGASWTDHVHAEAPPEPLAREAWAASPADRTTADTSDADALMAMYGARRVSSADPDEPNYNGYKVLIAILALALLAIVVGLLLISGR